jgi:hypothetical protein
MITFKVNTALFTSVVTEYVRLGYEVHSVESFRSVDGVPMKKVQMKKKPIVWTEQFGQFIERITT